MVSITLFALAWFLFLMSMPVLSSQLVIDLRIASYRYRNVIVMGGKTAVLDVSVENPRAEALYGRLGFVVTKEMRSSDQNRYSRVHHHRRMARPIE